MQGVIARYLREQRVQEWIDKFVYIPGEIAYILDDSSSVVD